MNEAGHGSIFLITSVGLLLRFVDSARVGRCHHVRCSECTSDVTADTQDVELGVSDFTTR